MLQVIIGIAMILAGGYLLWSIFSRTKKCTAETVATVTGHESKSHRSGKRHRRTTSFYPVVEFEANGQTIQKTTDISSSKRDKYAVGSTLSVRYNPEDPQEFIVKKKSLFESLLPALLMILLGAAMMYLQLK